MLILSLGDRPVGLLLALLSALMTGASRSLAAIPGQTVPVWLTGGVAVLTAVLAVEFLLECPTLTRIAAGRTRLP